MSVYGGGDVLASRTFDFGHVELTKDSRGFWLYRVRVSAGGVAHWRAPEFSALGYRCQDDAFAAAKRHMKGEPAAADRAADRRALANTSGGARWR